MAQEVLQNQPDGLLLVPDSRPVTCAVEVFKPTSASAIQSGAGTVSSYTATVSGVTSQSEITVSSVVGVSAGDRVWLTSQDGWGAPILVSEIVGSVLVLEGPPPSEVQTGDTLFGLQCTFNVAAIAERGMNYRVQWQVVDELAVTRRYQTIFHVVRMQFRPAITAAEVYRYASARYPGAVIDWTFEISDEIARRASDRVRRQIQSAGAYPHLIGDDDAFSDVGIISCRIELAREGLYPAGFDPGEYMDQQEAALKAETRVALSALQWIDSNDDGIVEGDEIHTNYTISAVRS